MQNQYLFLLLLLQSTNLLLNTSNKLNIPNYEWKYVSVNCQDEALWRKEMNYWYDQCQVVNDTQDGATLQEKILLLQKNTALDMENSALEGELSRSFPELATLNDHDRLSLYTDKKVELSQLEDLEYKAFKNAKPSPEHVALQQEVDELKAECHALELECMKNGYFHHNHYAIAPIAEKIIELQEEKARLENKCRLQQQPNTQVVYVSSSMAAEENTQLKEQCAALQENIKNLENNNKNLVKEIADSKAMVIELESNNAKLKTTLQNEKFYADQAKDKIVMEARNKICDKNEMIKSLTERNAYVIKEYNKLFDKSNKDIEDYDILADKYNNLLYANNIYKNFLEEIHKTLSNQNGLFFYAPKMREKINIVKAKINGKRK